MKILVSACLLGIDCKYNGKNNYNEKVINLKNDFEIVPICPESFGGLPIPRVPSEIVGNKVMSKTGLDVTKEFENGAKEALYIANENNARYAILKEKSPSCGYKKIYDGTFSGTLINGNGIAAELLYQDGIKIFGETKVDDFLEEIKCDDEYLKELSNKKMNKTEDKDKNSQYDSIIKDIVKKYGKKEK